MKRFASNSLKTLRQQLPHILFELFKIIKEKLKLEEEIYGFFKKEKENNVFKYIISHSNSIFSLFVTLEFLNKITFCEKEYHFFLNDDIPADPSVDQELNEGRDPLLDHEIIKLLLVFLENQLAVWGDPKYKLVRNSATNLISNLMRKFWLFSPNPEKIIDKIVACFFKLVISCFKNVFFLLIIGKSRSFSYWSGYSSEFPHEF